MDAKYKQKKVRKWFKSYIHNMFAEQHNEYNVIKYNHEGQDGQNHLQYFLTMRTR